MIAALAVLLMATAAPAAADNADLLAIADRFDKAQLDQDRATLEAMVDDDLVFIEGSGKRSGKSDFIAGWIDAETRYAPIDLIDRTVVRLGPDAGIVSAETMLSGTSAGKPFAARIRFSDTFHRLNGQWRAVHIQVTRIPS